MLEIDSEALPEFDSVSVCTALMAPTVVLGKDKLDGVRTACGAGAGVPVPERGAVCGEPVALSAMVMPAVKVVADAGVKLTVMLQLDSTATLPPVMLQVVETRLKSVGFAPVIVMLVRVSGALPEFVTMI
jgi:hypothetical protein